MKTTTFILLFITSIAYSQTKKTIVPTSGAIVLKKIIFLFPILLLFSTIKAQDYYVITTTPITKDSLNNLYKKYKNLKTTQDLGINSFITNRIDIKGDSIIHYGNLSNTSKINNENIFNFINKPLPDLFLEKYDKGRITNDSLKGKPTIIDLWFTTCSPCIKEIPTLNKFKEKYGVKFNYVAVTFEDKKKVKPFLKKHNFTFDILLNGREFLDSIGNGSYPKVILVDKNNIIKYIDFAIPEPHDNINKYNEFLELIEILIK